MFMRFRFHQKYIYLKGRKIYVYLDVIQQTLVVHTFIRVKLLKKCRLKGIFALLS
jgi:hypothetical protein